MQLPPVSFDLGIAAKLAPELARDIDGHRMEEDAHVPKPLNAAATAGMLAAPPIYPTAECAPESAMHQVALSLHPAEVDTEGLHPPLARNNMPMGSPGMQEMSLPGTLAHITQPSTGAITMPPLSALAASQAASVGRTEMGVAEAAGARLQQEGAGAGVEAGRVFSGSSAVGQLITEGGVDDADAPGPSQVEELVESGFGSSAGVADE